MDPETLLQTLDAYRRAAAGEIADPFEKSTEDMSSLTEGPFYAINMNGDNPMNPIFSITVGGLLVDERSGLVMRKDGTTVPGLYAAGDCAGGFSMHGIGRATVFGRIAGMHAASLKSGTGTE